MSASAATDWAFQPTLPARGATVPRLISRPEQLCISTHAPRTGSDALAFRHRVRALQFQPTLPARGATSANDIRALENIFQPTLPARGATLLRRTNQ